MSGAKKRVGSIVGKCAIGQGRILSRSENRISPWVSLIAKEVEFAPGQAPEIYHSFAQPDYISILARTRSGLIPLVRQYRPAVEDYTLELPAGMVEEGEEPIETCRRELMEEVGLVAEKIKCLGSFYTDTGRHENDTHVFFVDASEPDPNFIPEAGIEVEFVKASTLRKLIDEGEFRHLLHVAALALVMDLDKW